MLQEIMCSPPAGQRYPVEPPSTLNVTVLAWRGASDIRDGRAGCGIYSLLRAALNHWDVKSIRVHVMSAFQRRRRRTVNGWCVTTVVTQSTPRSWSNRHCLWHPQSF